VATGFTDGNEKFTAEAQRAQGFFDFTRMHGEKPGFLEN
jgi:hypothetical protein